MRPLPVWEGFKVIKDYGSGIGAFVFQRLNVTQVLIFVGRKLRAADFTSDGSAPVLFTTGEEFTVRAFIQSLTNAEVGTRVKSGLFVLQVTLASAT